MPTSTQEDILQAAVDNTYINKILAWGPGIFDELPYISTTSISSSYLEPLNDTLLVYVNEFSNFSSISNTVVAQILNSNGIIIDSVEVHDTVSVLY